MTLHSDSTFSYTVPPAPVQVTAAPTADGITVSWRWNDNVLICIRSIKIVYQPVGGNEEWFDIQKSKTICSLRNRQCNMGCAIIINSLDLNGSVTNTTCTTSGRTQICRACSTKCTNNLLLLLHICLTLTPRLADWPILSDGLIQACSELSPVFYTIRAVSWPTVSNRSPFLYYTAPTGVRVEIFGSTSATVTWQRSGDQSMCWNTTFLRYQSERSAQVLMKLDNLNVNSVIVPNLQCGTSYYFTVMVNTTTFINESNTASIHLGCPSSTTPTSVVSTGTPQSEYM